MISSPKSGVHLADGKDGQTKTDASDGYVPLHSILAQHLQEWKARTPHRKDTDFVFPSLKAEGRVPLSRSAFVADHLRAGREESRGADRRRAAVWASQLAALA